MKKNLNVIVLLSVAIIFTNCTLVDDDEQTQAGNNFGYETEAVSNIMNTSCAAEGCHNSSAPVNGFSTYLYSEAMLGATSRPLGNNVFYGGEDIVPFNAGKSLVMQFVEGNITSKLSFSHRMLSSSQISTLRNWIDGGAKNYKNEIPFENPASYRVYVCNSGSENISVIDGTERVVSRIVNVDDKTIETDSPYWVAESGSYYYVTFNKANKFVKIRKSDNIIVATLSNVIGAGIIKIMSSGLKAYVSRSFDSNPDYNTIYVVDLQSMTLQKMIQFPLAGLLHGMALDENRGYLYVADAQNNMIHIVSLLTDLVIDTRFTLTQNYYPLFIEVSPDGNYLYVSASNTNGLLVFNAGSRVLLSTVPLRTKPYGIAVSKFGDKIYVASNGSDAVEVVTKTGNFWDKTNTILHPTMSSPFALSISSDDRTLFVTNVNSSGKFAPAYQVSGEGNISTVSIINTSTESVENILEVEEASHGIAVEKL